MEEWVANILTQVPLAVAVLIVWNIMDWRQAGLDKQRESSRAADNKAQNKTIGILLQSSASFAQSANTFAAKVERLADYTAGVKTAVDIGFEQTATSMVGLGQHLEQQDSRIPAITQTVIDANEAAMKAHEERMIEALESMEQRLMQCVDETSRASLYEEILKELKAIRATLEEPKEPPPPPPTAPPPARL